MTGQNGEASGVPGLLQRPRFFPGQWIDYRDFNRLSAQSDEVTAFLCRHLFEGGGLVVGALGEFEVVPQADGRCLVKSGVGLLPDGTALVSGETLLDLQPYLPLSGERTLVVSIRSVVRGRNRFTDPDDSSITGYLSEVFEPEIVIGTETPAEALELFRVRVTAESGTLRHAEAHEEWEETSPVGVVDLRWRRRVVPQTFVPFEASGFVKLRKALYELERAHRSLGRIFLIDDTFSTDAFLAQLHAEILSRPFQPLKVGYLITEFADKLSRYLEAVNRKVGAGRADFDRTTYLSVIERLDHLKERQVVPRATNLTRLIELAAALESLVDYAEKRFSLLNTIEEALLDVRDRLIPFDDKWVLGGQLFQRVDLVSPDDEKRVHFNVTPFARSLEAQFRSGDSLVQRGKYIAEGEVTLDLQIAHPDRPVVILLRQYIRRAGSVIHYEINGQRLATDREDATEVTHHWRNRGLVCPAELLIPQGNRLQIRVEKSDLDFGIFELAVFQPVVQRRIEK